MLFVLREEEGKLLYDLAPGSRSSFQGWRHESFFWDFEVVWRKVHKETSRGLFDEKV